MVSSDCSEVVISFWFDIVGPDVSSGSLVTTMCSDVNSTFPDIVESIRFKTVGPDVGTKVP